MNWNLRTVLLAVAVVAALLAVWRGFWEATRTNHHLLLGLYLLLVLSAAVTACRPGAELRGGLIGASLFGVVYLVCVLKGGFGLENIYDAQALAKYTRLGFALLGLSFLVTQLSTMLLSPSATPSSDNDRST